MKKCPFCHIDLTGPDVEAPGAAARQALLRPRRQGRPKRVSAERGKDHVRVRLHGMRCLLRQGEEPWQACARHPAGPLCRLRQAERAQCVRVHRLRFET